MEDALSRLQGLYHPSRASASVVDNVPVHTTSADVVVAPCDGGCTHPTLDLFVSRRRKTWTLARSPSHRARRGGYLDRRSTASHNCRTQNLVSGGRCHIDTHPWILVCEERSQPETYCAGQARPESFPVPTWGRVYSIVRTPHGRDIYSTSQFCGVGR